LTYAVDPLRHVVFGAQRMPPAARQRFPTGVELFGHILALGGEIAIVGAFAIVFLGIAIHAFGRPE
jgi:ABC-2 type transport system permease protein